jgi:hypothetical protein
MELAMIRNVIFLKSKLAFSLSPTLSRWERELGQANFERH